MFDFRNIDKYIPGRFERMGMLKGKRWYTNTEEDKNDYPYGLFKPQRKEFGNKKLFCANHYGEFIGYLLGINAGMSICKVELAHLSEYYETIHKYKNGARGEEKNGCITYSRLRPSQELEHGRVVVDLFSMDDYEKYSELSKDDKEVFKSDNLEIVLASIENRIRNFAQNANSSPEVTEERVKIARLKILDMMVYDCLYGNNDRHDENWALVRGKAGAEIDVYPLYDNERVLGLYENIDFIEESLGKKGRLVNLPDEQKREKIEKISKEVLFSRMRVPGEQKRYSYYTDVLEYLMANYKDEVLPIIERHLKKNTPQIVSMFVASCKDLPESYVEFQKIMYESRYNFARELCDRNKQTILGFRPKRIPEEKNIINGEREIV